MLPKNKRVTKDIFPIILKKSKIFHSKNLTLRVSRNKNNNETTKFSFVVSRKVSNKATERNLLKRRGNGIVSKLDKNIKNGFICVFYVKKSLLSVSYHDMEEEITRILGNAKIIS